MERYIERLKMQLNQLASEQLPCHLSQDERHEIVSEVMQEALLEVVKACASISRESGLSEGTAIAELTEHKIGGRIKDDASCPFDKNRHQC